MQSIPAIVTGVRLRRGDLYFYQKVAAGENTLKLYLRHGLSGEEKLLVDPEKITVTASSQGKGRNALSGFMVSDDGKYVAVNITPGGSENDTEIHVIDVATGRETGDVMLRALSGVTAWLPDNHSLTYDRLQDLPPGAPRTAIRQKRRIYLHLLGTDPQKDPAVLGYGVVPSIDLDPNQEAWVLTSPGSPDAVGVVFTGTSVTGGASCSGRLATRRFSRASRDSLHEISTQPPAVSRRPHTGAFLMRRTAFFLTAAALVIGAAHLAAQTPNLAGTWTLIVDPNAPATVGGGAPDG